MGNKLGFVIDKITNSIEEISTGKAFETSITLVSSQEIKKIYKKDGWLFNWKSEFKIPNHEIYKLTLLNDPKIQGLISLELIYSQSYIEMHLIENAPHNLSKKKQFLGVAANMVAFACKMSFDLNFNGFVSFTAKTRLVDHYIKTLGAQVIFKNNRMGILTKSAKNLVNSYYKNHFDGR